MSYWKSIAFATLAFAFISAPAPASAQVAITVGVEPVCPYGYFDYPPYDCAPYGYYGPDWFADGVFFGAGPWYHGPHGWYGHVDNRYDPHHGYTGPLPERGTQPFNHFQANEARDGQGHTGTANHDPSGEHTPGYSGGGHPGGLPAGGGHPGGGTPGGGGHH